MTLARMLRAELRGGWAFVFDGLLDQIRATARRVDAVEAALAQASGAMLSEVEELASRLSALEEHAQQGAMRDNVPAPEVVA